MTNTKPYYAVIFTSLLHENDPDYDIMAQKMITLADTQPGFLGVESARNELGITVSYWEDLASIVNWKRHTEHIAAQQKGIKDWYHWYKVRICKVEREYEFSKKE